MNQLSSLSPALIDPEEEDLVESKDVHYNYLQLLCFAIGTQHIFGVAGRGMGKTTGILAPRGHKLVSKMPGASGVVLGTTLIQLLTRTLPELFAGLEKLGYQRDVNYWVRKFPDKKLGLKMPYSCPMDPQHAIFLHDGKSDRVTVARLVGQDRPGTSNGLSIDWIINDETRYINKAKYDVELAPTNRGNTELFGHCAEHHSTTFTTDMPTSKDGAWILKQEDEFNKPFNKQAIELILAVQLEIYKEKQKLKTSPRNQTRLARIAKYEQYLNQLRRDTVLFAQASSFANVHILGLRYFKELYRTLPPLTWQRSVLNKKGEGVEDGFYPDFNGSKHFYDSIDYAFVESRDFGVKGFNDCRKDSDIDHARPLVIAMDYGNSFNCMWVGQSHKNLYSQFGRLFTKENRYLNCFGLPWPSKVKAVVKLFCEYYKYFYRKEVDYLYDHTAVSEDGKDEDVLSYAEEVRKALEAEGWKVNMIYIGQTPSHHDRYLAWGICLSEENTEFPLQRFNRENTRAGVQAMNDAKHRQGSKGFEKDKTDEKNRSIDQSTTTHYTDAMDTLFWYFTFIEENRHDLMPLIFK